LAREAYFLEFAQEIAAISKAPIMTTGGIRRREVAEQVLASGVPVVGLATALAMTPDLPESWRLGLDATAPYPEVGWKDKTLAVMASMAIVHRQLQRLGDGKKSAKKASPFLSLIADQLRLKVLAARYRKWLRARSTEATSSTGTAAAEAS
jgi:2,4-dienoyl-CoA reductase-like NADH-dependent reductase (Old Yellow Enzyme family)